MNRTARALFKIAGALSSAGKEAYRNDYDLRAETYDVVETRPMLRKVTEELLARINLQPGMRCIDLGCGTGHATRLIAEKVLPIGNVLGCDFSREMLHVARSYIKPDLSTIGLIHKEMQEFLGECESNTADFICAFWSADYCNHKKLLPELNRVLKQGGTVAMLINTQESLGELQKLIVPILLKHPYFIKSFPPIDFPPDADSFKRYILRSGFIIERLEEEVRGFNFSSGQSVVTWIKESGPAAGILSALRSHCIDKFFRCIEEAVNKRGGLTITFRFLIFVGEKQVSLP